MNLSTHIQDRRHALGYSVEIVARETGLAVGTIRAYEQGRRSPSAAALMKLDKILELDGSWYNTTTWQWNSSSDVNRSLVSLALDAGFHGRRQANKSQTEIEKLRLALIQKLLTADPRTLAAIDTLI